MKKRIFITILALLVLVGALAGIKYLQIRRMMAQQKNFAPPPEVVTTTTVRSESWERLITAVGSLVAVQGVDVSAELSGKVVEIAFEAGAKVKAGDLLLQQNISSELAQLQSAEVALGLAKMNFERYRDLLAKKSVAQATFDDAQAQYKQSMAQVDNIRTIIDKKTIRAPFAGRLGIRLVNLGQILKEGDPVVSLQTLDPIFVNFLLPQQDLAKIQDGLTVRITSDAFPGETIEGKITAINPGVDSSTRNIKVQATVANTGEQLRPGMYVNVAVVLPGKEEVLTIPSTALLYAPYSDSVFLVDERKNEKTGKMDKFLRQQFVRLGEKRGDYVAVVSGLSKDETVVSTGAFKLRNGQAVVIDNTLSPDFKLAPKPKDS